MSRLFLLTVIHLSLFRKRTSDDELLVFIFIFVLVMSATLIRLWFLFLYERCRVVSPIQQPTVCFFVVFVFVGSF